MSREKSGRGTRDNHKGQGTLASVVGGCSLPWHEALDQMPLALCFGPTCPTLHDEKGRRLNEC